MSLYELFSIEPQPLPYGRFHSLPELTVLGVVPKEYNFVWWPHHAAPDVDNSLSDASRELRTRDLVGR